MNDNLLHFTETYCIVDRADLAYIQFILESYEGMAIMSTVDREKGIVAIHYPSCFATEVGNLISALEGETSLRCTSAAGESEKRC